MKTGKLIPLSVQETLDCCPLLLPGPEKRDWSMGLEAFNCIGGIESEKTYPYRGDWNPWKPEFMHCSFDKSRSVAHLTSSTDILVFPPGEVKTAKALIESGPLANHMNAAARSFQFYSEGKYFQFLSHSEF